MNLFKSIFHNIGVVLVGFVFALLGKGLDHLLGMPTFAGILVIFLGVPFIVIGFGIRVWAAYEFYQRKMKVIVLKAQKHLVTTGPFRYSRNPLYLGGNLFIFGGAVLCLGTFSGLMLTVLELILTDRMIRREEEQLEKRFGKEFVRYQKKTHRWI